MGSHRLEKHRASWAELWVAKVTIKNYFVFNVVYIVGKDAHPWGPLARVGGSSLEEGGWEKCFGFPSLPFAPVCERPRCSEAVVTQECRPPSLQMPAWTAAPSGGGTNIHTDWVYVSANQHEGAHVRNSGLLGKVAFLYI